MQHCRRNCAGNRCCEQRHTTYFVARNFAILLQQDFKYISVCTSLYFGVFFFWLLSSLWFLWCQVLCWQQPEEGSASEVQKKLSAVSTVSPHNRIQSKKNVLCSWSNTFIYWIAKQKVRYSLAPSLAPSLSHLRIWNLVLACWITTTLKESSTLHSLELLGSLLCK